jgi:hypothetical protein
MVGRVHRVMAIGAALLGAVGLAAAGHAAAESTHSRGRVAREGNSGPVANGPM